MVLSYPPLTIYLVSEGLGPLKRLSYLFDTADLTAVLHRKSNYCMDRIMMPVDADGTNSVAEKTRPNICHMCMKKGELGKESMYCDECKIAVYCSKARLVLCQREC
jgi:hypothetical protein